MVAKQHKEVKEVPRLGAIMCYNSAIRRNYIVVIILDLNVVNVVKLNFFKRLNIFKPYT
jgi:hypothetical protein